MASDEVFVWAWEISGEVAVGARSVKANLNHRPTDGL